MVDLKNPERVRIVESDDRGVRVNHGVVSSKATPMAVIEISLGLSPDLSGMLGNRKVLVIEGGIDDLILRKLSGLMKTSGRTGLADEIYLWIAGSASKTPMYAAFCIGQKWAASVLLDSDKAGQEAAKKIKEKYLTDVAESDGNQFRVLMLGDAAGIGKTDAEVEDLFAEDFYLECVNETYSLAISLSDLPEDGSSAIVDRLTYVLKQKYNRTLDKKETLKAMFAKFDQWSSADDLPDETGDRAEALFKKINACFGL